LTPKYGKSWLNTQERTEFADSSVVGAAQTFVFKHPVKKATTTDKSTQDQSNAVLKSPPGKRIRIMAYLDSNQHSYTAQNNSISDQFRSYLETISRPNEDLDTKNFWLKHELEWPELAAYTKSLLTVPASTASVERIFSVGGAILKPSRRRLSDKVFEMLMFLKCNLHLFKNSFF
jgi:hypothetical protein